MYTIDLTGKTALIAGVANHRSLAWAVAKELARSGVRLMVSYQSDRFRDGVQKLTHEIPETVLVEMDVASDESMDRAFGQIQEQVGRIDYLVHAVAFAKKEDLEGAFYDTSRDGYHLALDISAYSLLAMTHRALPMMGEGASIVSLSYIAAQRAVPNYNVMGTAKAALEHATRQLAHELGPRGIRVNCVSAGPVNTLSARGITGFTSMLGYHSEKAPLRRNITPHEVGMAALFLLSPLASGITGETLYVDAGYHITI